LQLIPEMRAAILAALVALAGSGAGAAEPPPTTAGRPSHQESARLHGDFHKFWWKNEGEASFDGFDSGESETDLLYSRLVSPLWSIQAGVQYANEWSGDDYHDRWSAVLALQGLAPYKFEVGNSPYLCEHGDLTAAIEAEYDVRIRRPP